LKYGKRKYKKIPKKQGLSQENFVKNSSFKYTTLTKIEGNLIKKPSVLIMDKLVEHLA